MTDVKKPAYRSPADIAQEMTLKHAADTGCADCDGYEDDLCRWHSGYREGVAVLLLKAWLL